MSHYSTHCSYSIHYPSDMKWGSQDENGTWNGLAMEVANKVIVSKNLLNIRPFVRSLQNL